MPLVNGRSQAAERTRLARPHTEGSERRRGLPGTPAPYLFGRGRRYTPPPPAQPPHVATAQAARLGRQRGRSATTSPAIGPSATTSSSAGRPALQVQPELGSDTLSGAARKSRPRTSRPVGGRSTPGRVLTHCSTRSTVTRRSTDPSQQPIAYRRGPGRHCNGSGWIR